MAMGRLQITLKSWLQGNSQALSDLFIEKFIKRFQRKVVSLDLLIFSINYEFLIMFRSYGWRGTLS